MINWFDMPAEGLSNGGQFEIKELTATENKVYQKDGEVYNKVTVNVEGGGGSSDFSTAEVTFICSAGDYAVCHSAIENGNLIAGVIDRIYDDEPLTFMIPLLNGQAILNPSAFYDADTSVMPTLTGSIEMGQEGFTITGDGTITLKGM